MDSQNNRFYLLQLKINIGIQGGVDLPGCITKVATILTGYASATTCVHKFKVTGEPRLLAVFEVSNVIGLERTLSALARLGYIDVICCQPLIKYQLFAKMLGVEDSLVSDLSNTVVNDKSVYWFEFNVEYPGKSTDELLATWKREATAALGARVSMHMELYKVVGERKIHALLVSEPEELDKLSFNLPVMKENGNGTTIVSRGLQDLEDYVTHIAADSISQGVIKTDLNR